MLIGILFLIIFSIILGCIMFKEIYTKLINFCSGSKPKHDPVYPPQGAGPYLNIRPQPNPDNENLIDWDLINAARQNPATSWTSWTTTVSSSGVRELLGRGPGEVFIEKAPEEDKTLKEHDRKDSIKLKSRFELLKE